MEKMRDRIYGWPHGVWINKQYRIYRQRKYNRRKTKADWKSFYSFIFILLQLANYACSATRTLNNNKNELWDFFQWTLMNTGIKNNLQWNTKYIYLHIFFQHKMMMNFTCVRIREVKHKIKWWYKRICSMYKHNIQSKYFINTLPICFEWFMRHKYLFFPIGIFLKLFLSMKI